MFALHASLSLGKRPSQTLVITTVKGDVPVQDDRKLFEFLILEGAQPGLSRTAISNKSENYRKAFDGFALEKFARSGPRDVCRLLRDLRHCAKPP